MSSRSLKYNGSNRDTLRRQVESFRDIDDLTFSEIGSRLNISGSFASTLYREAKSTQLSILDRLKLWFTFRM